MSIYFFDSTQNQESVKSSMLAIRRLLGGKWNKNVRDNYFDLERTDGLKIQLTTFRESVCVKRVVGTKEIEEPVYDYAPVRTEKKTVDIVEWDCPESLST